MSVASRHTLYALISSSPTAGLPKHMTTKPTLSSRVTRPPGLGGNYKAIPELGVPVVAFRYSLALSSFPWTFGPYEQLLILTGGEGGIRTHGTRKGSTVFETARFNHSRTSPHAGVLLSKDINHSPRASTQAHKQKSTAQRSMRLIQLQILVYRCPASPK
jgi:hypothetical protein